jgi:hypothetical protein
MKGRNVLGLTAFVIILGAAPAAVRANFIIDFERFPGPDATLGTADDVPAVGNYILAGTNQFNPFSSIGVTFSNASSPGGGLPVFQADLFPGGGPDNHYLTSSPPALTFSPTLPVYGVTAQSYSFWDAVVTAFDASGGILARNEFPSPNGETAFALTTLSIATDRPISRLTIIARRGPDQILNLDNFVIQTTPVPEPSTLALAGIAASVGFGWWWRRRRCAAA